MCDLRKEIENVAQFDVPVLITGETGTGKELVAKAIHGSSARSSQPFVAINCAAMTSELFESEVFGHEKGAFTSATKHDGLFVQASGGTLFLDEIGDLDLRAQAKLLRVLNDGTFRPVRIALERAYHLRHECRYSGSRSQRQLSGRSRISAGEGAGPNAVIASDDI